MEFLRKELDGIPADLQQVALKQIEEAVRAACMVTNIHEPTTHVLPYVAICVKLSNVIDFLQKTRKVLQEQQS